MDETYIDYQAANTMATDLKEHGENIQSTTKKLNDYLGEMNNNWKASKATKFSERVEEFVEEYTKLGNYYMESADTLMACSKAYQEFDQSFSSQEL